MIKISAKSYLWDFNLLENKARKKYLETQNNEIHDILRPNRNPATMIKHNDIICVIVHPCYTYIMCSVICGMEWFFCPLSDRV